MIFSNPSYFPFPECPISIVSKWDDIQIEKCLLALPHTYIERVDRQSQTLRSGQSSGWAAGDGLPVSALKDRREREDWTGEGGLDTQITSCQSAGEVHRYSYCVCNLKLLSSVCLQS